jgi:methylmalonyl-CoA mutase N-terminal domain/subunit
MAKNKTISGIPIKSYYGLENPGEFPFTSGIYDEMYRNKLWTMRQYSGFSSAEKSNERYRYLLNEGVTGLSVAFDLPTQTGYDSDHELAFGEVGKVGVPICTIEDMRILLKDLPLDKLSISMTINSTAIILIGFLIVVAEENNFPKEKLRGTVQNDILKEYIARGTYIFPPKESMKLVTDIFEYCNKYLPHWNTISVSGYHIREAGSTAVEELAFTFSNAIEYIKSALDRGLNINDFASRISFFFNCHNYFFEEIAKFRAARRLWANIMKERFKATNQKALLCRFHVQTAGSSLQAQQIDNNVVRTTLQGLSAVLGGTQSLHTNSKDEALSLPTEGAAKLALRTQQIIAHESGVTDVIDPLAGSHYIENLTNEIEKNTLSLINEIDELGGAISAIENNFQDNKISESAFDYQQKIEDNSQIIVGTNKFRDNNIEKHQTLKIDEDAINKQLNRLKIFKEKRDSEMVKKALYRLNTKVEDKSNLLEPIIDCIQSNCTLGEITLILKDHFGEHH